jgi:hypothetical protein
MDTLDWKFRPIALHIAALSALINTPVIRGAC